MRKLVVLLLPVVMVGCGGTYLTYKTQPAAASLSGKVAIEVRDAREPNRGGDKKEQIGLQTGAFGVPAPIRLKAPEEVAGTVAKLITESANAAGVAVVPPGAPDATGKLVVEVQRFWCTGYNPAYKADVTLSLTVTDPSGAQVRVPGQPLHADAGGMECRGIYKKLLTQLFQTAKTAMAADPIKAAAAGAAPSTASAAPPNQ
jgi:hypothetical protein